MAGSPHEKPQALRSQHLNPIRAPTTVSTAQLPVFVKHYLQLVPSAGSAFLQRPNMDVTNRGMEDAARKIKNISGPKTACILHSKAYSRH